MDGWMDGSILTHARTHVRTQAELSLNHAMPCHALLCHKETESGGHQLQKTSKQASKAVIKSSQSVLAKGSTRYESFLVR